METSKLSYLAERFFPSFYQDDAKRLIEFFRLYLQWLEQEGNPYHNIDNLKNFTDITNSIDGFQEHLKNELLAGFPDYFAADLKYLMHIVLKLYQSKGNIYSYKMLFRALYDSFCRISYPRDFILKTSDGKWVKGYYLFTDDIPPEEMKHYTTKNIKGLTSNATGIINSYVPYFISEDTYEYCFSITDVIGDFIEGETIEIYESEHETSFIAKNIIKSGGYWSNTDGFLNSEKVLQDSFYYQNFSYEITSMVPLDVFKKIVTEVVHPAGFKIFSNMTLTDIEAAPYDKTPVTFLRWFIIRILIEMESILINFEKCFKIIYNSLNTPSSFYTPDYQLYYKEFGAIEGYQFLTAENIEKETNESCKLIFDITGKLHDADFVHDKIDLYDYYVVSIINNAPKFSTRIGKSKKILHPWFDNYDMIWVFDPDGYKVADSNIKHEGKYIIFDEHLYIKDGEYTLYSVDSRFLHSDVIYSNVDETIIEGISANKNRVIPFVDGIFSYNKLYNDGTLNETGFAEIYQFKNNQDINVQKWVIDNDYLRYKSKRRIKYTATALNIIIPWVVVFDFEMEKNNVTSTNEFNITLWEKSLPFSKPITTFESKIDERIIIEPESIIDKDFDVFSFIKYGSLDTVTSAYISDYQIKNKSYGEISSISSLTAENIETETEYSSKLVFDMNGKLYETDFTEDKIDLLEYYVLSIVNNAPRLKLKPENHVISYPWIVNYDMIWVFDPDGYKIADSNIKHINNEIFIDENVFIKDGEYTLYSLDSDMLLNKDVFTTVKENELNIITDENVIVPFVDGLFAFDNIKNDKLDASGYVESYTFKKYQDINIQKYENTDNYLRYKSKKHIKYV